MTEQYKEVYEFGIFVKKYGGRKYNTLRNENQLVSKNKKTEY
jgi:hypothetical protein